MSSPKNENGKSAEASGMFHFLWTQRLWWLLPLVVLFLLIGAFYILGHLSAADPETYPTTRLSRPFQSHTC